MFKRVEEVDEADLMKMASEAVNQIDSKDNSTDDDWEINNYKKA